MMHKGQPYKIEYYDHFEDGVVDTLIIEEVGFYMGESELYYYFCGYKDDTGTRYNRTGLFKAAICDITPLSEREETGTDNVDRKYKHSIIRWKCPKCGDVVISDTRERHRLDRCKCGAAWVDAELYYTRWSGGPVVLDIIEEGAEDVKR